MSSVSTGSTVAEAIANRYLGDGVEIYMDTSVGRRQYFDFETEEKTVVVCKVLGADGEMLIVECEEKTAMESRKCEVLLNGWMIKGVIKKSYGVSLLSVLELEQQPQKKR